MSLSSDRRLPPPESPMYDLLVAQGRINATRADVQASRDRLFNSMGEDVRKNQASKTCPLEQLHKKLLDFFPDQVDKKTSEKQASVKFAALQTAIEFGELKITAEHFPEAFLHPLIAANIPWRSCKLAASLVLILAAPRNRVRDALTFLSASGGGRPTLAAINSTPSADVRKAFKAAKKAAIDGKVGKVTIIGVNLVDVEMIERTERSHKSQAHSSFAHSFVLGVSREGVRIYQAWGREGYSLLDWIDHGDARIRNWKEAEAFIKSFGKLANAQV